MMGGSLDINCFLGSDGSSDDETIEAFDGHEAAEIGELHQCNSYNSPIGGMILTEPSAECSSMGGSVPCISMAFKSLDEAREFYYEYAERRGFTIRTNRIRNSLKDMAVIGRDFVCSREGFRAARHASRKDRALPPRPVTREGCKAMIRLAARDGGQWIVTKFVEEHNHKLMTRYKFPGELPTVNILSEEEKDKKIQDLYDELQHERERSAAIEQQIHMILKDLEEHAELMSLRVEDIVKSLKEMEMGD